MITYTIKTKRQPNGLWGTPITLINYNIKAKLSSMNHELLSAIVTAYSENNNNEFKVEVGKGQFRIFTDHVIGKFYEYSNYELLDNTLYFFQNHEDRTLFERMVKLKKIKSKL